MSERGSWVTEYIYCRECAAAARVVLLGDAHLPAVQVADGSLLPIFAGKVSGTYAGEELQIFEYDIGPALSQVICHPLRVAVMADNKDSRVFTFTPEQPAA